jgi:23S rRNA pseudouridine955/2504/2580 synthase
MTVTDKPVKVRWVTVDDGSDGQRIDNFLLRELKGVPRTHIYRLLRKGEVRVNKGRVKANRKLISGDVVRLPPVRLPTREEAGNPSKKLIEILDKSIIYEDNLLLIINKPSGLAVHGGSGISFGVIEVLRALRPEAKYLELAHRLDRDTSGCLMIAKKRSALRILQDLQREGKVHKRYLALLKGHWRHGKEDVRVPLKKNVLQSGERRVKVDPEGKDSRTIFRVRRAYAQATLVEAELKTGRTHQIRVHAAWLNSPILGDTKYGDEMANKWARSLDMKRLFLHAAYLRFPWPGGTDYDIEAPLPKDLLAVLEKI